MREYEREGRRSLVVAYPSKKTQEDDQCVSESTVENGMVQCVAVCCRVLQCVAECD